MVGVLQVGTSLRATRHSSLPSEMAKAARNELVCTSHCTMTLSPSITGELAKPHCAVTSRNQPESSGPRSFFQINAPFVLKQNKPSDPKMATTRCPSVAGVELQWLPLGCRLTRGTASSALVCQRILPDVLSRQSNIQRCETGSSTETTSP